MVRRALLRLVAALARPVELGLVVRLIDLGAIIAPVLIDHRRQSRP